MSENNKLTCLSIGGVKIGFVSQKPLPFLNGTLPFRCSSDSPDVRVILNDVEELPEISADYIGNDGIFRYYRKDGTYYKKAIEGAEGAVSLAVYREDFSCLQLYVKEGLLPDEIRTADKVLQFLPVWQILAHHQAFLLHSSRIIVGGKAILFTAPSQTGKTTQARLWSWFAHARIAGNDRTLIRKRESGFETYGYPVDGSSPVYSSEQAPLGAVVVLRQGKDNVVRRLPAPQAIRPLMEQTAMDVWDPKRYSSIHMLWPDLLEKYPIYQLTCRPDEGAVICMKQQLEKDEVISFDRCS